MTPPTGVKEIWVYHNVLQASIRRLRTANDRKRHDLLRLAQYVRACTL